jgi:predicted ATPase/class 3 adenylate cyclase/DNA-binding CsgD family transcriptional regulator
MADLPTGTVTFLLADIADGARLWEQHLQAMPTALKRYAELLGRAVEAHGGTLFQAAGEARGAVFPHATGAVAAALAIRRALEAADWSAAGLAHDRPLRERIALHSGPAELRDGVYTGEALRRATRLRDAGHGGQILLSRVLADQVRGQLPSGVALRDLGPHQLAGLSDLQHIFQLAAPDLPDDFPPLKTLDRHRTNLPAQLTPLIGREHEVAAVCALVRQPGVRLMTLTGPGGTGKTRLGMQIAATFAAEDDGRACFPDGVVMVALAPLDDPALVIPTVAKTLGVQEIGGGPPIEALVAYLHDRQLLILLDNFEHLLAAATDVAALLAAAPGLKVIATSRSTLHVSGEHEYAVPPLPLPPRAAFKPQQNNVAETRDLTQYAAVALFVQRAQAARPDFRLTAAHAPPVVEICLRLDGLPLAIELAAARVRLLPPEALLARLTSRLELLTGGPRDLPARQQTLRQTIDWSYNLLDDGERALFRRLGVFAGGCTLAAAAAVAAAKAYDAHDARAVASNEAQNDELAILDTLTSLVNKSVLREEQVDGEPRFMMLETIREYALEQLAANGETAIARQLHALFFLALAEEAEPQLLSHGQATWLARLDREHDNLRAALASCIADGPTTRPSSRTATVVEQPGSPSRQEIGLRLAGALSWFWFIRGLSAEGRQWTERALAQGNAAPAAFRAKAYSTAGTLAFNQTELEQSALFHQQALALYQALGDQRGIAFALNNLGGQALWLGDIVRGEQLLREALPLARAIGDGWLTGNILNNLGIHMRESGNSRQALMYYRESLELYREQGDRSLISIGLFNSAEALLDLGEHTQAAERLEEALAMARTQGNRLTAAFALQMLGRIGGAQGQIERAIGLYEESVALFQEVAFKRGAAEGLEALAALAAGERAYGRAARLLGAAEVLREASKTPIGPVERPAYDGTVAALHRRLDAATFAAAWNDGRAMTPRQALALRDGPAVALKSATRPPRGDTPAGLTEREVVVLRLLAQGLSYADIADQLAISPRTVNHHLTSIYGKLDVASRHAATRFAIEHHLA